MKTKLHLWGAALLSLSVVTPAAYAVGTAAGTDIINTAVAEFDDPDNPGGPKKKKNSNPSVLTVDELLDATIVQNDAGRVAVASGDSDNVLSFTVTNTGNGPEQHGLTVTDSTSDNFDPTNVRIYIDNGDGIFDPLSDTLYVPSGVATVPGNELMLAPDESVIVFVVADIPGTAGNGDRGDLTLTAEALTAQATDIIDAPGFVFAGSGAGGTDAVVGSTQAYVMDENGYIVSQILTSFDKSSTVLDPFGGSNPVPGAVITYTLVFTATGSGNLDNLMLVDDIPANTTYMPGTITLNGMPKTDIIGPGGIASPDDEVIFNSTVAPRRVEVDLGTVTVASGVPETYTVTFKVQIN